MTSQRDLFPATARTPSNPDERVELTLHVHDKTTDKAWLLSKTGMDRDARFIPRSRVEWDERLPKQFRMTHRDAMERGWL